MCKKRSCSQGIIHERESWSQVKGLVFLKLYTVKAKVYRAVTSPMLIYEPGTDVGFNEKVAQPSLGVFKTHANIKRKWICVTTSLRHVSFDHESQKPKS